LVLDGQNLLPTPPAMMAIYLFILSITGN